MRNSEMMQKWCEFYNKNKGTVIGLAVGLVVAILFLTIGFFKTLLIAICAALGVILGTYPKTRQRIKTIFINIYERISDRFK